MAKGIALNIGVNKVNPIHYDDPNGELTLKGCVNDAKDMNSLAQEQGFQASILLDENATRNNVIQKINQAAAQLDSGDIFFISYSGHGSRIPDTNGDEDDFTDETWCLYDAQLIDDELKVFWGRFKAGVRVLVISDSCHSGTITKLAKEEQTIKYSEETPRYIPFKKSQQIWKQNQAFYQDIPKPRTATDIKASVRLLSGCQDNQYSYDGNNNGAFTAQLLRVWDNGRFRGNYHQFHSRILSPMPAYQSPNHSVIGQTNIAFDQEIPFSI